MFKSRYRLCDAFGIPIYVDFSFAILIFVFVTQASLIHGVTCAIILAFSVVMHELGHSLTARAFGYHTSDITISLLGGCASLTRLPKKAWQELITAIAGPLVSFALSLVGFMIQLFFPIRNVWLFSAVDFLTVMNFCLGVFNLLPGFPMDGGRIFRSTLRAFLSRSKATFVAMWVGRVFAILLGLSGLRAVFSGGNWGLVRILIAWMIWREGWREYLLARSEECFGNWTQDDFRARVSPPPYERD